MVRMRLGVSLGAGVLLIVAAVSTAIDAQQPATGPAPAAGRGQAPAPGGRGGPAAGRGAAPLGVARDPLGDGPWVFDTAEQHRLKLVSIARGLVNPWSLVFLPDGSMLVTERPGRLRIIRNGVLDPAADHRRARGGGAAAVRPDGDRAAPALRREPVALLHLQQAGREGHDGHHARARPLRRQDADAT